MENPIAGNTICYRLFSLERALQGISRNGLKYVELASLPGYCEHFEPQDMSPGDVQAIAKLVDRYHLIPISMSGHCDLGTEEGVAQFQARMEFARDLGMKIINTGTGENTTDAEGQERFYRNIAALAEQAEAWDLVIALETHGDITGKGEACVRTMERIGSDRVRVNYDPANVIYYEGVRPEQDIGVVAKFVAHFHVKDKANEVLEDFNFPAIGEGIIDFKSIFDTLRQADYQGPYSLEVELDDKPETPEIVDTAFASSIAYLKTECGWQL